MGFMDSVRPRLLLVPRGGSPGLPRHQETERRRNAGQHGGRQGATQLDQPLGGVWHDAGDGIEPRADGANAPAQPADSTGQGNVGTAQPIGRGFHASGRAGGYDAVLDSIEQARPAGGKEVRQQAERTMALWTIPAGNAHSPRCPARIAAMACKGATARRMQRTARQLGSAPLMVPNICLGARRGVQRNLHRGSPSHRCLSMWR